MTESTRDLYEKAKIRNLHICRVDLCRNSNDDIRIYALSSKVGARINFK
jgi:hypothetical protein